MRACIGKPTEQVLKLNESRAEKERPQLMEQTAVFTPYAIFLMWAGKWFRFSEVYIQNNFN